METLYEIDRAIEQVIETGFAFNEETGEVLFDEKDLDSLEVAFKDKLEACGLWIKNTTALAKAIREEEKELAKRRNALEARVERIEDYVIYYLGKLPKPTVETPKVRLSTRKSTRTIVDNEELVPEQYKTHVTTTKVSKTDVAKALKRGEDIPGVHIEVAQTLQVK